MSRTLPPIDLRKRPYDEHRQLNNGVATLLARELGKEFTLSPKEHNIILNITERVWNPADLPWDLDEVKQYAFTRGWQLITEENAFFATCKVVYVNDPLALPIAKSTRLSIGMAICSAVYMAIEITKEKPKSKLPKRKKK